MSEESRVIKEELNTLNKVIRVVKEEIGDLTEVCNSAQSGHIEEVLKINSRTDDLDDEIKILRQEILAVNAKCEKMSTEEERLEPYVVLLGKESTECWSPSGNPPICPVLFHSGEGQRLAAIGNQFYKSGGEKTMQDCYVATLGQNRNNTWNSIPSLNVSSLK